MEWEEKFEKNLVTDGDCWAWTGYKSKGYGYLFIKGKSYAAHRLSWEIYNGSIPEGLIVRHKCKNKCCNPEHLELGTLADNQKDRIRDGTDDRGEKSKAAKLTATQVLEIRRRYYESQLDLAKEFNVCQGTISAIICRKNWKSI